MKFNVQCTDGHVYEAPKGSDLERRCKERVKRGYLDALILHPDQCEECIAERSERLLEQADVFDTCFNG